MSTPSSSVVPVTASDLPPLLRPPLLAALLGISEHGVRALCRRGQIPAAHIGRTWIVRREALLAFLEGKEREVAAQVESDTGGAAIRLLRGLPSRRRLRGHA